MRKKYYAIKRYCIEYNSSYLVFAECREDSDIYILLDASGSMKEKNYKVVRDFVANQLIPILGVSLLCVCICI